MNKKKVFIIEYDENNNEIDRNCIADEKWLLQYFYQFIDKRYLLDKEHRNIFTNNEWGMINDFGEQILDIYLSEDSNSIYLISHVELNLDKVAKFKRFFNEHIELQKFVKKIFHQHFVIWNPQKSRKKDVPFKIHNFNSCYNWVKNTSGIYYSVNNKGEHCWNFIDEKPTIDQAKYQKNKGRRIIFLSFKDWKEYIVNLNEFK